VENRPRPGSSATEAVDCGKGTPIGKGSDLTVRDLMPRRPKTLPRQATVGDLRRLFPLISSEAASAEAMDRLDKEVNWGLVVVGSDGVTLEGLLCLNSKRSGFCQ